MLSGWLWVDGPVMESASDIASVEVSDTGSSLPAVVYDGLGSVGWCVLGWLVGI